MVGDEDTTAGVCEVVCVTADGACALGWSGCYLGGQGAFLVNAAVGVVDGYSEWMVVSCREWVGYRIYCQGEPLDNNRTSDKGIPQLQHNPCVCTIKPTHTVQLCL